RELFLSHPWTDERVRRLGVPLDAVAARPDESKYTLEPRSPILKLDRPLPSFVRELAKFGGFLIVRIWAFALAAGFMIGMLPRSEVNSLLVLTAVVTLGFLAITVLWSRRMERINAMVRARLLNVHGQGLSDAAFCGMSPGLGRFVFDTGRYWDVGLVKIHNSVLYYAGDRASLMLPRSTVRMIEIRPGRRVLWMPTQVVCIHLAASAMAGIPASIALDANPGGWYRKRRRLQLELFETLQRWHTAAETPDSAAPTAEPAKGVEVKTVQKRMVSVRAFGRYAALAVAPVLAASWAIWGMNGSPEATLPSVAALLLIAWFLGPGVIRREEMLVNPATPAASPENKG
ncbi:MAG TPA: hypothetical protein VGL53_26470, partial [Bryobacteraceae bacterium]